MVKGHLVPCLGRSEFVDKLPNKTRAQRNHIKTVQKSEFLKHFANLQGCGRSSKDLAPTIGNRAHFTEGWVSYANVATIDKMWRTIPKALGLDEVR